MNTASVLLAVSVFIRLTLIEIKLDNFQQFVQKIQFFSLPVKQYVNQCSVVVIIIIRLIAHGLPAQDKERRAEWANCLLSDSLTLNDHLETVRSARSSQRVDTLRLSANPSLQYYPVCEALWLSVYLYVCLFVQLAVM